MYAVGNPKTKAALKKRHANRPLTKDDFFQPALGPEPPDNGEISVEGPHFPEPHTWYARVKLKDGKVISIK